MLGSGTARYSHVQTSKITLAPNYAVYKNLKIDTKGLGEMVRSAKYFPCKCEDLALIPRIYALNKLDVVGLVYNPWVGERKTIRYVASWQTH